MLQQTKEKPQKRATQSIVKASKRRGTGQGEGVGTEAACQLLCLSTKARMGSGWKGERELGRELKLKRKPVYPFQHSALHTTDSPSLTEHSSTRTTSSLPPSAPPPPPCPIAGHRSHLEISKTCLYNKMYKQVFSLVFFDFFFCILVLLLLPSFFACVCRQFRNLF